VVHALFGRNVKDAPYSAVGNNVADDTAAFQAALNVGPGEVWVPYTATGYKCGALTIPPGVRLRFERGAKLVAPAALATSWIKATIAVHNGTEIVDGTFDATATASAAVAAVLDFSAVTSCANTRLEHNRIINAPVHGMFLSEATAQWTQAKKWVRDNTIEGHGIATTGFGIYADYIGSVEIEGNYVYGAGASDAIELGHSGPAWLGGLNAHMRARGNTCVNGQINYPFSDYAEILGNTVLGNTIQNDNNTANHVLIEGNTVLGAAPAAGFAGICASGRYAKIVGNEVTVVSGAGIQDDSQLLIDSVIEGNTVITSAAAPSGTGIGVGGSAASGGNVVADNVVVGKWNTALQVASSNNDIHDNVLDCAGANFGIYVDDSADTGYITSGNTIHDNKILGVPATLIRVGANSFPVLRNNTPYNPVGAVVVAVPASGTPVAAAPYDRTFYISAGAGSPLTMTLGAGGAAPVIPGGTFGTVFVKAGVSPTPTWTGGVAPTWIVEGD
jgi:hypothetical protein